MFDPPIQTVLSHLPDSFAFYAPDRCGDRSLPSFSQPRRWTATECHVSVCESKQSAKRIQYGRRQNQKDFTGSFDPRFHLGDCRLQFLPAYSRLRLEHRSHQTDFASSRLRMSASERWITAPTSENKSISAELIVPRVSAGRPPRRAGENREGPIERD